MRLLLWLPGRLLGALVVLVGVSILIFAAVRSLPGGYADVILGSLSSPEARAALAEQYGLDKSIPEQYLLWVLSALRGDFGTSMVSQLPVTDEFASRLPLTLGLGVIAIALTVLIGIPLGVYTGTRSTGGRSSVLGRLVSSIGISVPEFVLASVIVFLFSRFALGLRVGNVVSPATDLAASIPTLILPGVVLAVFCIASTARTTRDAVLGVLVEPHVGAAVARGESKGFIIRHHVLRNASIPILTLVATLTAYLLGGAVIVETVFDVPGLGSYLVQALGRRDYAVIQSGVLLATVVFVVMSLLVDVLTGLIDPRVSVAKKGRWA
ncbi:ABC transporter permease [Herbiconiux sp.]|uniref:ABC transporter permease n=1 Tax=Herbiconiux sp. TaxID=1871186 RepID=UPI0025C28F60|nr:ABC transporter permease [Herbiconiux sp.]